MPAAVALAHLFGCDGDAPREEAAPAGFRVANGAIDEDNDYPYVARLSTAGSGCSGILITPGLVLTANHCFREDQCIGATGVVDLSDDDWDVNLGNGPFPADLDIDNQHSFSITRRGVTFTQPVIERIGDTIDMCSKDDPSQDLAIVRLDERVPVSQVTPMHVPVLPGYPGCDETLGIAFDATAIGFGECVIGPAAGVCPGPPYPRTFSTSNGYSRESVRPIPFPLPPFFFIDDLPGAVYSRYWLGEEFVFGSYDGILPGDSGGPLITAESFPELMPGAVDGIVGNHGGNLLCGTSSRYYGVVPYVDMVPPPPVILTGNDFAAVDDDDNADWLAEHVVAADGNFIGECFAGDPSLPSTLELRDKDTDRDLIPDMCDPCPEYYEHDYDEGLAPGPDADGDGVPDRCDNCMFVQNEYSILGSAGSFTREQVDVDNDGYGELCDTCRASDQVFVPALDPEDPSPPPPFSDYTCCVTDADCAPGPSCPTFSNGDGPPPPPPNTCVPGDSRGTIIEGLIASGRPFELCENHCAFPVDTDCDATSDLCDTCPETWNPSQSDADADGVGDSCDNCKGLPTPHPADVNPECDFFDPPLGDQFCQSLHPNSVCLPPHPSDEASSNVARCSLFDDDDSDGVGQACDSCEDTANPAPYEGAAQKNCNVVDEIVEGVPYPYIGDACDRNPCTKFSASKQTQSESDEEERGWVARIDYAPRLLGPWHDGHPYYGDPFDIECEWEGVHCDEPRATTGLRFCSCDELGADGKPDPLECQNDGCTIDVTEYDSPGSWWKPSLWPHLSTVNGGDGPYQPEPEIDQQRMINPVPGDPLGAGSFEPENTPSTSTAYWYTKNDIEAHGGGATQLKGILWSHVTAVTQLLPSPAFAEAEYRPWANHYKGGVFGPPPESGRRQHFDLPIEANHYIYRGCPWELLAVSETQDEPMLVVDAAASTNGFAEVVGFRTMEGDVELGDAISTDARVALGQSSVMWVGAAEKLASPIEGSPAMVALSLDGLEVPAVLGMESGRMIDFGGSASPDPDMLGRVGFGAALSATESTLFVIGGADVQSQSLVGDVLRYDIPSATWSRLALSGERPAGVRAATYRAADAALYVVDRVGGGRGVPLQARLIRIDVSTGVSTLLGQWAPARQWTRTFLANTTDGRLLLASSSPTGGYMAVAFDPTGDLTQASGPSFLSVAGQGYVAVEPTLTDLGITVPIADRTLGVANTFLPTSDLLVPRYAHDNLIGQCL
ncbi:MAG: trypsin-like serine protease [Deltaproteobacteria bacterium]|nr:trypsin-like serine protease [Nannocystaceae bacterium]